MAVVSAWTPTSWATSSSASRLPSMSSMRALMRSASSRAPAGAAGEWRTAYAIDGDTIKVGPTTVRLLGYDTPEVGQRCHMDFIVHNAVWLRYPGLDRHT